MAKEGLHIDSLSQLVPEDKPWALCVGAGISYPVFPTWNQLAQKIANQCIGIDDSKWSILESQFSADVLIQSSYEFKRQENPSFDFSKLLSSELYSNLLDGLKSSDKKLIRNCMGQAVPSPNLDWQKFIDIIRSKGAPTALPLADVVTDAIEQNANLTGIMTFNAEALLAALINAYAQLKLRKNTKVIDWITEPTSSHYCRRIPYYFCHGLVPIPGASYSITTKMDASDKLVFLENEYHRLANNAYSWQASTFFNLLSTNKVFFIGLSFRDPNLRRWLSWMHEERKKAITRRVDASEITAHYWIEKDPGDADIKRWYEASVAHLGIRIIWIEDWVQCKDVFYKSVVALKSPCKQEFNFRPSPVFHPTVKKPSSHGSISRQSNKKSSIRYATKARKS